MWFFASGITVITYFQCGVGGVAMEMLNRKIVSLRAAIREDGKGANPILGVTFFGGCTWGI